MERSEPTFVPEWLKSSGSLNTTSHQFQSSSLHSDEQGVSKTTRNKSFGNDIGRPSVSDRTTSSYFRRSSSSIGRYSDKEKSGNRHRDYSDSFLGNILPTRFENEGLRRSHSSVSAKRADSSWPRKVATDSTTVSKPNHNNGGGSGGGLRSGGSGGKITFERDFPSLGADEKQSDSEIGRVPSPGLSSAIQSLPVGNVAVIGGDGWTSALAEVPVIVGSNGGGVQPVQSGPVSVTTGLITGRNMAETLAQGPPRSQTAPQLTIGSQSQRLEELAVKQSRQLIPMTPSLPKPLALNACDKAKSKGAQLQPQSSQIVNLRPVSTKFDPSKTVGKLQVLKPSRERNGNTPISKDNLSPTSPVTVPSTVVAVAVVDRKPGVDKRPSSQAQSRNDFFNLMRKKSMTTTTTPDNKPGEGGALDTVAVGGSRDADVANESDNSVSDGTILHSEEEEARFLRSLGWEETGEEEEGLTEEEINSFYRDVSKYLNLQAASKIFKGTQQKLLMGPLHSQMGKKSSDSNLEFTPRK